MPPYRVVKGVTQPIIPSHAKDRILETFQREQLPSTVKATLGSAMQGDLRREQLLFHAMVDTWPRLAGNIKKVQDKVANAPWEVTPWTLKGEEPSQSALDKATLAENGLDCMASNPLKQERGKDGLIKDIVWGYYAGHSVSEIYWHQDTERGGEFCPRASKMIPARYYRYPTGGGLEQEDILMLDPSGMGYGNLQEFPENRFIVSTRRAHPGHPTVSAPLRVLTQYWLAATFGLKWFMQFAQKFGTPFLWGTVGASGDKTEMCSMLENMGASGAGAFDSGTEINALSVTSTGEPHQKLVKMADSACDIFFLGQTLTSDVGDSGSRALGEVHQTGELDILDAACDHVAESLQQYTRAVVELNYGEQTEIPRISAQMVRPEDENKKMERDRIAGEMGIPMGKEWFYTRHSIPMPEEGEELLVLSKPQEADPDDPGDDPDADPEEEEDDDSAPVDAAHIEAMAKQSRVDKLSKGILKAVVPDVAVDWLGPVKPVFDRLAAQAESGKVSDQQFIAALRGASNQMPELFDDLDAEALERGLESAQTAMLAGAEAELLASK